MTNGMRTVLATTVALSAVTLFAGWEDEAWRFARTTVYCPKTKLVYDYRVGTGENALVGCLPTPKEIRANFPVVTGWSTGMEDSVLSGTTLLLAAMARYDRLGEPETLDFLHDLFDGLCHCCEYAKVPGFLARSICPADGRSHYINSSRDQYTLYVYAFWQYYRWPKATEAERARIRKILVDIARYAEKCVTPENNYSLLREDGGNAFVCKMWTATPCVDCNPKGTLADYGEIHPHETLRLPEIYAAAHAVSGDRHWREMELKYADPGIEMSNGPIRQRMLGYALYQMQISVNLLYTCETDAARKARYLALLKRCVSLTDDCFDYIRKKNAELKGDYYATIPNWRTLKFSYLHWKGFHVDDVWSMHADWPKQFEDTSFVTREVAEFVLIASLCPGAEIPQSRIDILESVFANLDFSRFNQSSGPVHALLAKERLLASSLGAAPVPDAMSVPKPGAVRPEGWLRDWALAAAKGYTGHMDEVDGEFVKAWREDFTPRGEKLNWTEGTWSFEGGAYWFDGLVRLAFQLDDPDLKALAKKRLDPVLDHMNGRSIGFCWWLDRRNEQDLKDVKKAGTWLVNWVAGISSRPLSAWYEATGDIRAKKALVEALGSDYWVREFKNTFTLPGGCYEAWRLTGDARILEALRAYAADLVRNPARATFSLPPKAGLEETLGLKRMEIWTKGLPFRHGVITQEDILSVLAAYRVTGDTNFLATVRAWQGFLDRHVRLPFGATVMDEEWGHPGPGRGTEACALAAEEWTRINCLAALGEGRWGDDVERAFFNAAPAMTDRAWRNHVYFAVPNRLTARPIGRLSVSNTLEATCATYARKHDPLCCTAGLNRTLPNYVQAMWMKTADGGVAAALYGPCRFETELKGGRFAAVERTDYPFGDTVAIEIAAAPAGTTPIRFRKPAWCAEARFAVNGADVAARGEKGFVTVSRVWKAGDRVTLVFPMKPRVEVVRDLDETGKDFACLLAGPLLFARGFAEKDANTPAEPVGLPAVDPKKVLAGAKLETAPLPHPWDWPLASPVVLRTSDAAGKPLKLVPYGCTKLRVSMFPVGE